MAEQGSQGTVSRVEVRMQRLGAAVKVRPVAVRYGWAVLGVFRYGRSGKSRCVEAGRV